MTFRSSREGAASGRPLPPERERLRPLATCGLGSGHPLEALWLARTLWNHWPPRTPPRPVVLIRRPDATDDQWDGVRVKLGTAVRRLAAAGVPVVIEWGASRAHARVDNGDGQLDLFAMDDDVWPPPPKKLVDEDGRERAA